MRNGWRNLGLLAALMAAGAALAVNPKPTAGPEYSARVRDEASQYAPYLLQFVSLVSEKYVREVSKVTLLEAAIQGLYEAARHPVPAGLRAKLEASDGAALMLLIARYRADLGDHEAIRGPQALRASVAALTRVLDPHSGIAVAREFTSNFDEASFGVGIEFTNVPPPTYETVTRLNGGIAVPIRRFAPATFPAGFPPAFLIKAVVPGSPAQRSGLRPGDQIVAIDGRSCRDCDPAQYYQTFYPDEPANGALDVAARTVTVQRPGQDRGFNAVIMANKFDPESVFGARRLDDWSWDYMLDKERKLGYLRLGAINQLTDDHFERALKALQAHNARGLILDLRWCPGGYLKQAIEVAKCVLPADAPVYSVSYRYDDSREVPRADIVPNLDLPILALIGNGTLGGGELIAAALQDHKRAILAGDRTFGKASVQRSLSPNPIETISFKLTTGTFLRPSGKNLQRFPHSKPSDDWGVRPDAGRWLPLSPGAALQLKEWWTWHALRPAGSREPLPTDDPDADPQLKAAVEMLRQLVKQKN